MSLEQLDRIIGKVEKTKENLERNLGDHFRRAALNALGLIDYRVTETGLNAEGRSIVNKRTGEVYSPQYKAYKKSTGRQVAFVDLQLTGDMWKNIGIVEFAGEGGEWRAVIKARNPEQQAKLDQNAARYGSILDMSDEENEEVTQILLQSIINDIEFL